MKYYLGIDGGGTKTVAAVADEEGRILFKKTGKTINFYSVGMEASRKNLASLMDDICKQSGICEFSAAFIGCSALDNEADEELINTLCSGVINAEKIAMNSDLYIALRSLGDVKCPCAAVCGTGSMAVGEDENGIIHTKGGWGHIVGDEGSGYSIAIEAFKVCCNHCDAGIDSPILRKGTEFWAVDDFRKAIDKIYSPEATKDVLATFAEDISALSYDGDETATEIIINEAVKFAKTVLFLLDEIKNCSVLGLYGGVFVHNSIFTSTFTDEIKSGYPHIEIQPITTPPEESAIKEARKM